MSYRTSVAPDVVVVGAGAAGIIAAWRAAALGARVVLLEKNIRIGTKILISGGGKCNITHDGETESLLRAFRPNEARFLRPACYRFTNQQLIGLLTSRSLKVAPRADGRIFPTEGTARDVVSILGSYLDDAGVDLRTSSPVLAIESDDQGISGVMVQSGLLSVRRVILAVGGSSYPGTGTTGDGFAWARALGHTIVPVRPALAPIYLEPGGPWNAEWSGIALRDVLLKVRQSKEVARWRGDLLMTHHGVSGPCALGVSRVVAEAMLKGPVALEVDLAPGEPYDSLRERLDRWIDANPRRTLASFAEEFVPQRIVPAVLSGDVPARALSEKARNRAVERLRAWPLGAVRAVPIERGEVVAGGVDLDEVDPHSMRSRHRAGLYVCGEILDIAGPVGGYNLQAAFATGFVAGESAAHDVGN